jgi:DNA-binding response OmpR family regulator
VGSGEPSRAARVGLALDGEFVSELGKHGDGSTGAGAAARDLLGLAIAMEHATPTPPRSDGRPAGPAIALIGDRTRCGELDRAAPRAALLALPFDPPCDAEALAGTTAVFVDACSDAALAIAECGRLRAGGLLLPLLLLAPEPVRLQQAAARAGATRVLSMPLSLDEIREFLEPGDAQGDGPGHGNGGLQREGTIGFGAHVVLDRVARRLSVLGHEQPISLQKFELLCYLADRPGRAVEPSELVKAGVIRPTQVQRIRALIAELRDRLGPAANLITTVPGFGYRLDLPR